MTTRLLLCSTILVSMLTGLSHAGALDIPQDYREHAQQVEFLSNLARQCEIRLQIYGLKGRSEPPCPQFLSKVKTVMAIDPSTTARWVAVGGQVDRSKNRRLQLEWLTFHQQYSRDLDDINKVFNHLRFLY